MLKNQADTGNEKNKNKIKSVSEGNTKQRIINSI